MAKIVVTTGADVVANDGQTSLREAVAQAADGDTITFAGVFNVLVTGGLNIGKDLNIEGARLGGSTTNIVGGVVIDTGATATMSYLSFRGNALGADGGNGTNGEAGLPGTDGTTPPPNGTGTNGGKATNGNSGLNATAAGAAQAALFGIENNGTLTLDHVEIFGNATGGDGGNGGRGGDGGSGGHGGHGDSGEKGSKGGNGGRGGDGANAGDGGLASNGADAVAGIINTGTLTIKDSFIHGCVATGGEGGEGGWGGHGGIGGQGGSGGSTFAFESTPAGQPGNGARGGDGGNAGSGANGGNGGDGVAGILNSGTITIVGATILYDNSATGGGLGFGGQRGAVASGGSGGSGGVNGSTGAHGTDGIRGTDGVPGIDGLNGVAGSGAAGLVGGAPVSGTLTFGARHFYEFDRLYYPPSTVLIGGQGDSVNTTITLRARMIGDTSVDGEVHWRVVSGPGGPAASDFVGGVKPSGTLDFDGVSVLNISFQLKPDAGAPRNESFTIQLFNPLTGDVLGSQKLIAQKIVNVKITDGNDRVTGTDFDDTITGLNGNDNVKGGRGDDSLSGNNGNDMLNGGRGQDFLTGGTGRDKFDFTAALSAANIDSVADFAPVDDAIRIDNAIFAGVGAEGTTLAAGKFHIGANAHDLSDRIIYDDSNGALYFDADGRGGAAKVQFATLDVGLVLTNADFLVI